MTFGAGFESVGMAFAGFFSVGIGTDGAAFASPGGPDDLPRTAGAAFASPGGPDFRDFVGMAGAAFASPGGPDLGTDFAGFDSAGCGALLGMDGAAFATWGGSVFVGCEGADG